MKALLDVDGVVADFSSSILQAVGSKLSPQDHQQWDVMEFLTPDEKSRAREALSDIDFWLNLPLKDMAKQGVEKLRDLGFQIVWVTSPWTSCLGWDTARRSWLSRNFGDDPVVITADKEHVDGDVFIDDKVENVEKWSRAHPDKRAFLFDAPYNRDSDLPRVSWDTILAHLL